MYKSGYGEIEGLPPLPKDVMWNIAKTGHKLDGLYRRVKNVHDYVDEIRIIDKDT